MKKYKNLLLLHLIVFIYGFTAILGALISIPSDELVWYRMLIALIGILVFILMKRAIQPLSFKEISMFLLTGIIIALHWIFFFEAIKVSTVSVTLVTLSSATLFTALLEPLFFKRKVIFYEAIFGIIILFGLYMIFNFETQYRLGIMYTLFSALMASLFTVINGKFATKYNPGTVSFYEMAGGFLGISVFFLFTSNFNLNMFSLSGNDLIYLLILGLVCTAFAFVVSISIMKELTPFTVTMTINLEPVYGIILAYLIFRESEKMTTEFYLGALIILATIFTNGWLKSKMRKRKVGSSIVV
ncbi:MAG: DMT family transporter [Bacteroidetes bacterium]|nr:DMT family transporter [Bacteroidota bacterium]HET6244432.1 DMT family transporter [Bacteroidia bacterium]